LLDLDTVGIIAAVVFGSVGAIATIIVQKRSLAKEVKDHTDLKVGNLQTIVETKLENIDYRLTTHEKIFEEIKQTAREDKNVNKEDVRMLKEELKVLKNELNIIQKEGGSADKFDALEKRIELLEKKADMIMSHIDRRTPI
jgi:hypothetical protein